MKDNVLEGNKFYTVGSLYFIKQNLRGYFIEFHKGGHPIARIYWHNPAQQLVLETQDGVCLKKETIIGILPFMNMDMFRAHRRLVQSKERKEFKNKSV